MSVPITPGSGKTIKADVIAGEEYQAVKLYDATAGSTNAAIVDASGNLRVVGGQSTLATYSFGTGPLAPTAARQLFVIEAPASGVIRLQRIIIWQPGSQTTAGLVTLQLLRTTTASSGGTAITPAPVDSSDAAYGGIVRSLPTSGTESTVLDQIAVYVPAALAAFTPIVIDYAVLDSLKAPVIPAGTANGIALKHPGSSGAAKFSVSAIFTVGS